MSFTEEFVRRLATVKCSDMEHPIKPVIESVGVLGPVGFQASSQSLSSEEQRNLDVYFKELAAQCPFCIARATIEGAVESPVASLK